MEKVQSHRFRGPHTGYLAVIFTVLFIFGLLYVISFTPGAAHYPNPYEPAAGVTAYFQQHPHDALMCSLFQFLSAIPLGLFTVTVWNRLGWLGVKGVGPSIGMFGGLLTVVAAFVSSLIGWTLAFPGVAADGGTVRGLYYLSFAIGGVGYSVPMGLLIAGIAVPAGLAKLLPRWMVVWGVVLGVIGEVSAFAL